MKYEKSSDDFNNEFGSFLSKVTQFLNQEDKDVKYPANRLNDSRHNRLFNIPEYKLQQDIKLEDFIAQVFIVLRDEFTGTIIKEANNTLRIMFPGGDTFRLQIAKDR